jgi:hypothetical protein
MIYSINTSARMSQRHLKPERLPLWVCREDVILSRHRRMASVPAFGAGHGRLKRVGRCIIIKLGVCHPCVSGNLLEFFSINETDFRVSGTITK